MADLQQGGGREEGVRGTEKGTIGRVRYRAVTWFGWAALGAGVGAGAGASHHGAHLRLHGGVGHRRLHLLHLGGHLRGDNGQQGGRGSSAQLCGRRLSAAAAAPRLLLSAAALPRLW